MNYYTGIGSRKTPSEIQTLMSNVARELSHLRYTLRSGGAAGADSAFESTAKYKRIYLPWNNFNGKVADGKDYIVPKYEPEWVWDYHKNPYRLSQAGLKLMSRNTYQVLGDDLENPLLPDFVLCYTEDGKFSGGTGQALRIASDYKVPIYNFFHSKDIEAFKKEYDINNC